eukprot:2948102-Rhodomonas_salina.1
MVVGQTSEHAGRHVDCSDGRCGEEFPKGPATGKKSETTRTNAPGAAHSPTPPVPAAKRARLAVPPPPACPLGYSHHPRHAS